MLRLLPRWLPITLAAALCAGSAHAQAMLPPNLQDESDDLAGFGEPPLWTTAAAAGYRQRLRLVLVPPLRDRIAIRIDTDTAGRSRGFFVRQRLARSHWRIVERRRFDLPAAEIDDLDRRIAATKLWSIYPEFWHAPGEICVDGVYVILERVTAAGYRFSEGNAQCMAPADMLRIAARMLELGDPGDARVASWLH
jgi:hypothetical protein